ncbi:MAG: thioredoxin family protein [Bacteroidota bacterium]
MKSILLVIAILLLVQSSFAKGIEFFEGTWEEAVEKAAAEEKVIFVDAYAEWCGPCKRMARNVFTDSEVGDYYNTHFINLKVDMEKKKNAQFAKQYPASAFPTLYYIDFDGKVVHQVKGARNVEQFINLGKEVLQKNDRSGLYAEAYEAGDRSPQLMYQYVKALNKASKPSLKIANDYINGQPDFSDADNLRFLLEATTQTDSRIFDLMITHRTAIENATSKARVQERIAQAAKATMKKALEYDSEELLEEVQEQMKKHYPSEANTFYLESEMHFAQKKKDPVRYYKAWKKYVREVADANAEEQTLMAKAAVRSFPTYQKGIQLAEKVAEKAVIGAETVTPHLNYAEILLAADKREEAKQAASRGLYIAKQNGDAMQMAKAMQLLKKVG